MSLNLIFAIAASFMSITASAQSGNLLKTISEGVLNRQKILEEAQKRNLGIAGLFEVKKSYSETMRERRKRIAAVRQELLESNLISKSSQEAEAELLSLLALGSLPSESQETEESLLPQKVAQSQSWQVPGMRMAPSSPSSTGSPNSAQNNAEASSQPQAAFSQLWHPPYNMKMLSVPHVPPRQLFPFDIEANPEELTGEVFLGQLSQNITKERIHSLIIAISNHFQIPLYVGNVVIYHRSGVCAFVTINSSAVPFLLKLRDSFVVEDSAEIAWFVEDESQRLLLASYFSSRNIWPRKPIVIETRVSPSAPKKISELLSVPLAQPGNLGISIPLILPQAVQPQDLSQTLLVLVSRQLFCRRCPNQLLQLETINQPALASLLCGVCNLPLFGSLVWMCRCGGILPFCLSHAQ
ncbi:MAG: hypothetical protein WCK49_02990 [Myxococcaceae bacterium]